MVTNNMPISKLPTSYLLTLLHVALGLDQPGAMPPACADLVINCIQELSQRRNKRTFRTFRSILVRLARFITVDHPSSSPGLLYAMGTCRCTDGPAALRIAPRGLHTPFRPRSTPASDKKEKECLADVVETIAILLLQALRVRPGRLALHRSPSKGALWPASISQLLPGDVSSSVQALACWFALTTQTRPDCTSALGGLLSEVIDIAGPCVIPGLMHSPALIDGLLALTTVASTSVSVAQRMRSGQIAQCAITLISRLCDLMFMDELALWSETSGGALITALCQALVTLEARVSTERVFLAYREICPRLLAAMAQEVPVPAGLPATLHAYLARAVRQHGWAAGDVHRKLVNLVYGLQWGRRCDGVDCLNDWVTAGRAFSICVGCKTMSYCSRACQKRSWNYPEAPHREVCGLLDKVGQCIQKLEAQEMRVVCCDAKRRIQYVAMKRIMSREQATRVLANVEALRRTKLDSLQGLLQSRQAAGGSETDHEHLTTEASSSDDETLPGDDASETTCEVEEVVDMKKAMF
jgi:hypothetical protein